MKTKSGMTTQVRGLPCLSNSGHGKPRLSYNGHMPEPLSLHLGKLLSIRHHLVLALADSLFFTRRRTKLIATLYTPRRRVQPRGTSEGTLQGATARRRQQRPQWRKGRGFRQLGY